MTVTAYTAPADLRVGDLIKGQEIRSIRRRRTRRSANYPQGRPYFEIMVGRMGFGPNPDAPAREYRLDVDERILAVTH